MSVGFTMRNSFVWVKEERLSGWEKKNDFIKAWLFVRTFMFQKLFESNPVMSAFVKRARILDSKVMVSYAAAVNEEWKHCFTS